MSCAIKLKIVLKSSNQKTIAFLKKILFNMVKAKSKKINLVYSGSQNNYVTLFKSPFVFKKAKTSYAFINYKQVICLELVNLSALNFILTQLEIYKKEVDIVYHVENCIRTKGSKLSS